MKYLKQTELAARSNITRRTIERLRWSGEEPLFIKNGGRVVYRLFDIEAYELMQIRKSTSDVSQQRARLHVYINTAKEKSQPQEYWRIGQSWWIFPRTHRCAAMLSRASSTYAIDGDGLKMKYIGVGFPDWTDFEQEVDLHSIEMKPNVETRIQGRLSK